MRAFLRSILRRTMPLLPMRGRHRLADQLGQWLMPEPSSQVFSLNGFYLPLDHALPVCRHMYYGVYEMPFVDFLQRTLREGDVFVDLGANIGYITAQVHGMVGERGRVIACEASPTCNALVKQHNTPFPPGVIWREAAVMDRDGTFPFCDTPRVISHGFGRVLHGGVREGETVTEVRAITVDTLLKEAGVAHVHALKVDVEGCERIALLGAKELLSRGAVDHIMVETTNVTPSEKEETKAIFALLRQHGMAPFEPDADGRLRPFQRDMDRDFRVDVVWRATRLSELQGSER